MSFSDSLFKISQGCIALTSCVYPQKTQEKIGSGLIMNEKKLLKIGKDNLKKFNKQLTIDNLNVAEVMQAKAVAL